MVGKSRFGGPATPAFLALGLVLAACDTDATAPAVEDSVGPFPTAFAAGDPSASEPVFGEIRICKTGNVAGTFDFDWTPAEGGADLGGSVVADGFEVEPGECFTVVEDQGGDEMGRFVTITEVPSEYLQGITCQFRDADASIGDCVFSNGGELFVNSFHGFALTFDNFQAPPSVCVGLTPGYWKNWENHYTEEQFLSLLPGTIAEGGSAMDAEEILGYGGPDPLAKLAKFVLANQLTMNLEAAIEGGDDLPNPDGAGLNGDCTILEYDGTLRDALAAALAIWPDNPEDTKRKDINALKDILDWFANAD